MKSNALHIILPVHLLSCVLILPSAVAIASNTEVHDLRIGLTPGRTRVVFDLSGPTEHKLSIDDNPDRVIVDLSNTHAGSENEAVSLQGTPISRIRSQVQVDGTTRYVFDIKKNSEAKLFTLPPHLDRGHRLVLDLHTADKALRASADSPSGDAAAAAKTAEATTGSGNDVCASITTPYNATARAKPLASDASGEWSGYFSLDTRLFFQSPAHPKQDEQNASLAFEPEYYVDWANGRQAFSFSPFFRYDANDEERSHADIRELYWRMEYEDLAFKAGIDVVFWGVTESQHLVDIINQTDLVENIDGEDKLGQPMLNLDYMNDWGTWQFYLLPYFRERTFPGEDGRLRTEPVVDTNHPEYESGSEEKHIDYALRWSQNIADWDIGLAHFSGTSREPLLLQDESAREMKLVPLYLQIDQTSLDIQATKGAWLWKLEAIYNQNKLDDYYAYVGGFEYTHFGVASTPADVGYLLEYNYDDRRDRSTTALQKDIYLGLRFTGNDIAGTRALAGIVIDTDSQSTFGSIEAARRFGETWTLALELRFFTNIDENDDIFVDGTEKLYFIRDDDYIEIRLFRYF